MQLIKRILFYLFFICFSLLLSYYIFYDIFFSSSIVLNYGFSTLSLSETFPTEWLYIKRLYLIFHILAWCIISSFLYFYFFNIKQFSKKIKENVHFKYNNKKEEYGNTLSLYIGTSEENKKIYLSEKSLYQNILITGTIGSGKTSSALYPFCKQIIQYMANDHREKIGMLILDAKGNFYSQVLKYANQYNRKQDVILISLTSNIYYNPLDKPHLKPQVLANRLKTILTLFSNTSSDSYWLDKVEQVLTECIKYCRLYNNGYVTFEEIHNLVTGSEYYKEKYQDLRKKFQLNIFSKEQLYDLYSSIQFFEKEFYSLDHRTSSIIKSEITRITGCFTSNYHILKTFSPKKNQINFKGFKDVIKQGKIVVLSMNIAEHQNLSKIIATYLKLDFQTEVLSQLNKKNYFIRTTCFVCDEFHEYITNTDADFLSQSRESKCINILATQSYSSFENVLKDKSTVRVIIQNLVNKLWFRNDDLFTIEEAQKQIGKEDKFKYNKSISENAKETNFNYITNSLNSSTSSLSETYSVSTHFDYIYDIKFFTQNLETFSCLAFLSNGNKIIPPQKLFLLPYFKDN